MTINIISASYGVPGHELDVTERVRITMRFGNRRIAVNNDAMGGDPAYGQGKNLRVEYAHDDGPRQTAMQAEGGTLVLGDEAPAFPSVPGGGAF